MEALILSCSTGGGHNSAGKAIAKELENRGWTTHFFDPYSLRSQKMADDVGSTYVNMVRFSPTLFGGVYNIGKLYQKAEKAFGLPNPVLEVQEKTALALFDWLKEHPVDMVLCSHPYPGLMLTWLRERGHLTPPCLMIPTDYTCIPFESDVMTDWMSLPHPDLKNEFHKEGVAYSRMIPSGIPVDPAFSRPESRQSAASHLHLDPKKRYILIGGGSMGIKGIWDVLVRIQPVLQDQPDLHVLVLCGSNKSLYQRIERMAAPNISPVAFTDAMPDYLHLASLFITKPGGLSITEAASCGTPLLLTTPIPGCETQNAKFFEKHGWARYARDDAELPALVKSLLKAEPRERKPFDPLFDHTAAKLADWVECAAALNPLPLSLRRPFRPTSK